MFAAFLSLFVSYWPQPPATGPDAGPHVLVFSRTQGFRHDSIADGVKAVGELGRELGFAVTATEDPALFNVQGLSRYRTVVFLNTSGDVLDEVQQKAFEQYINAGGGFVGVHAAADTEHDWTWYGQLVGARFKSHPEVQGARIDVLDGDHPSTRHLPKRWTRIDEWYNFQESPRTALGPRVTVLANLDESSYAGGTMGNDHPFAWCHEVAGGRSWYTAGGHTSESFADPRFLRHLVGGIAWAGRFDLIDLPAPKPARPPRQTISIDMSRYAGPHRWEGIVHVSSDDVLYHDAAIHIPSSGIPAGVTFSGDRSGITLRGISMHGPADGIVVQNNQTVNDVVVDRCRFLECRTPLDGAEDPMLGSRGYGLYVSGGRNWAIHRSEFTTLGPDEHNPARPDRSVQYAVRMGEVIGLSITATRFVNHNGKACAWFMFIRAASFKHTEFAGGSVRLGVGPDDIDGVAVGDCRNIVFADCRFNFGVYGGWPASVQLWPGCENIRFERCAFVTHPDSEWWIEIDNRTVSKISWADCTWNGEPIEGYRGVRTEMSQDEMRAKQIGPAGSW